MKRFWIVFGLVWLAGQGAPAQAEWVDVSKGLPEADIQLVARGAGGQAGLYAASDKRVYRFEEEDGWKQVLSLRGDENRVHLLWVDRDGTVFVGSDKGLQKSPDLGKKWSWVYRAVGGKKGAAFCVLEDASDASYLWVGTAQGLVHVSKDGRQVVRNPSFPSSIIHSLTGTPDGKLLLAAANDGIHRSQDSGRSWERIKVEAKSEATEEETLAQFRIEELETGAMRSHLVQVPAGAGYLAATASGVFTSDAEGTGWTRSSEAPNGDVQDMASSASAVYAATSRGLFQWDGKSHPKDISEGLPGSVHAVHFDPYSNDLYAATKKGIFRYPKPELKISDAAVLPEMKDILGRFDHEPTILQVQEAAIRYAEVHPEKIESWRRAAAQKAYFPTLSVGTDMGKDQNVDLDRGGTGDPDRFIIGPEEEAFDWHVDVSWDLSEIVWNGDQTSIDTRSKLMVELREDILNEVTHLYFERRRLQTELILSPPKELPLRLEKELKLQELTADIDALTGGFLSLKSGETGHVGLG